MTVTLELKPEVEARVVEQAASRGVPVEDFLESVIEESLNGVENLNSYRTSEEWEAALDEFADSPAFGRAVSFVDDSRESIYREREDSQL
jgi:hypothetical protein